VLPLWTQGIPVGIRCIPDRRCAAFAVGGPYTKGLPQDARVHAGDATGDAQDAQVHAGDARRRQVMCAVRSGWTGATATL
jgi:hypothetical protein